MSFRFHFIGARFDKGDPNSIQPLPSLRLFGRLLDGTIQMGDSIVVPTCEGSHVGVVSQFWDSLYDWFGMPFHERVTPENPAIPFSLVVHNIPEHLELVCPAMAHSPIEILAEQDGTSNGG